MDFKFSVEVINYLQISGWDSDRDIRGFITLPQDFTFSEKVQNIIYSFGKLVVGEEGAGQNVVKTKVIFDPIKAEFENEEDGYFHYYSNLLATNLYPLGIISDNDMYLAISDEGKIYILKDWISCVGDTFEDGLHNLLLGIKGKELDEETMIWE
jgi:SUKH-3 immunity protein